MKPEDLERLREVSQDFSRFRDNTTDGQGNNLHDIKNTFDYVAKTVEERQLEGTTFGSNLAAKAKEASNVLSQLWVCLKDLETSINSFVDAQAANNNGGSGIGGQGSTSVTATGAAGAAGAAGTTVAAPQKSAAEVAQEVWQGKWGVGTDRVQRLRDAGYDPDEVQRLVNQTAPKSSGSSGTRYSPPVQKPVPTPKSAPNPTRLTDTGTGGTRTTTTQQPVTLKPNDLKDGRSVPTSTPKSSLRDGF
ncbi:MAG: hypothetical protein IJI22_06165 [Bacilli bacterium]|nr:hypothetical protein [Bacilli bacterium]